MKAAETDIKSQFSVAQNPIRFSHEEKSELSLSDESHFKFPCIVQNAEERNRSRHSKIAAK